LPSRIWGTSDAAKIAALARAIRRTGVSLVDRVAMLEAVEQLANLAESEAALDRQCFEYFCDCSRDQWDDVERQLNGSPDSATQHWGFIVRGT
jgi:hypothetical protein